VIYRERGDSLTRNEALMAQCLREVYRRVEEEYEVPADVRRRAAGRRRRFDAKLQLLAGERPALRLAYRTRSALRRALRAAPWAFRRRLPPDVSGALRA
jgi:hypothetical protein